jgi:hypothetical protein
VARWFVPTVHRPLDVLEAAFTGSAAPRTSWRHRLQGEIEHNLGRRGLALGARRRAPRRDVPERSRGATHRPPVFLDDEIPP